MELTKSGEKMALEIVRHHRLIELFLQETLDLPWDRVHAEAEKIEHVLSEDLEDRIAEKLGDPRADPHGDPIPTKGGKLATAALERLADLKVGEIRDDPPHRRPGARTTSLPGASGSETERPGADRRANPFRRSDAGARR